MLSVNACLIFSHYFYIFTWTASIFLELCVTNSGRIYHDFRFQDTVPPHPRLFGVLSQAFSAYQQPIAFYDVDPTKMTQATSSCQYE